MNATGMFAIQDVIKIIALIFLTFVSDTCNFMKVVRNGVIAKIREVQPNVIYFYIVFVNWLICV